jgi:hypothetical protein
MAADIRPIMASARQSVTRYRRSCGVEDKPEGQRQSNIDFHSWRRWFITMAEQAGQPVHVIETTVGHKRPGMSMGLYSGGPSLDQLRACVEAVKLPSRTKILGKIEAYDLREAASAVPPVPKRSASGRKLIGFDRRLLMRCTNARRDRLSRLCSICPKNMDGISSYVPLTDRRIFLDGRVLKFVEK